jgi:tetratricopeptide (TPR) repeat protein
MGVVYEAEQMSLGRRVALKVLPLAATLDPRQLQRFRNEAHAAAQLQHRHIVPIHCVGSERGIHYYAMQYIDGLTLAAVIDQLRQQAAQAGGSQPLPATEVHLPGPSTPHGRPGTTPAAASPADRGRPDTGLIAQCSVGSAAYCGAVARLGEQAAEALQHAHDMGVIHRDVKPGNLMLDAGGHLWVTDFGLARVSQERNLTLTGDLVGTLRYMSPEQALGQKAAVDHRSDVYSLGATLYEMLTLRPACEGATAQALLRQITGEEPRPPRRLNKAIPVDLETIVLKAMAKAVADRYATAADMADDLRRCLEHRPIRAKRPTLPHRLRKWCRRHRVLVSAAAAVLVLAAVLIGGTTAWWAYKRTVANAEVSRALENADELQQKGKWPEALAAARRAASVVAGASVAPDLEERVRQSVADLDMVVRLRELRVSLSPVHEGGADATYADRAYEQAFRDYGVDVVRLDPATAAERLRARAIRAELAAALDYWAMIRSRTKATDDTTAKNLPAIARAADPDPLRNQIRDAWQRKDGRALKELAGSPAAPGLPGATVLLLGAAVFEAGGAEHAVALLRAAQVRHPDDPWINCDLAVYLARGKPPRWEEALRFCTAAVALRPGSANLWANLGGLLFHKGAVDEALAAAREAIRLDPDLADAHNNLGIALQQKGALDDAVAAYRQAIRLRPEFALAYSNLAIVLGRQEKWDEAITACRKAIRLQPDFGKAYCNLGAALANKGATDEALAIARKAIQLLPEEADAYYSLGLAQAKKGAWDKAVAACRKAIRLRPDFAMAYLTLGAALAEKGLLDEAVAAYRQSIRCQPDLAMAYYDLGIALLKAGRTDEGIAAYRQAVHLKPGFGGASYNLGLALAGKGLLDEAAAAFREVVRVKPDHPDAYYNLGLTLARKGSLDEAIEAWRQAVRFEPGSAKAYCNLSAALAARGTLDEAIGAARQAIRLQPGYAGAYSNLGSALKAKGSTAAAIAAFRQAVQLQPNFADVHHNLGVTLADQGAWDEAIAAYRQAIRLKPDFATAHCNLAHALRQKGQFAEALAAMRRGHELGSRDPRWPYPSRQWVQEYERLVEMDRKLAAILRGEQTATDAAECVALARVCVLQSRHGTAVRFFRDAFAARPDLADDPRQGLRYDAACAAALAAGGRGQEDASADAAKRAGWRRQALQWLRADLARWDQLLAAGGKPIREVASRMLEHWRDDPDLASVRGDEGVAGLSPDERKAWRELWADLDRTLGRLRQKTAPGADGPKKP